jgi:hypothetical protein
VKRSLSSTIGVAVLLLVGGPAAAEGPPTMILAQDQVTGSNPCTGEGHTLTFDIVILEHLFDNEAGHRHHENSLFFIEVTTDDGFSGRSVGTFIDNGAGLFSEEEGTGVLQNTFNINLSNDAHQRIKVHGNLHFNQVDGEVIAFVDTFSLRCAGKPA